MNNDELLQRIALAYITLQEYVASLEKEEYTCAHNAYQDPQNDTQKLAKQYRDGEQATRKRVIVKLSDILGK